MGRREPIPDLVIPGRNPDVGFLHVGGRERTPNISTHTGFGPDVDPGMLRTALDELARRAPLLVTRVRLRRHLLPGRHHSWELPTAPERVVPLKCIDVSPDAGDDPVAAFCAEGANRTIDLETGPPFQVDLLRHPDGSHDLVTTLHHALYDGASCGFVFYLLKRLFAAARAGIDPATVDLPRITNPGEWAFAARQLELAGRPAGKAALCRLGARGTWLVLEESRFRTVPVPGRGAADRCRSRHRTIYLDLDAPEVRGLGPLLGRREGTLNELLQAAVSRAFFPWGRGIGLLDRTLPLATTFNLRTPNATEYPLGNFETATCIELRLEDLDPPAAHLDRLIARSARQKRSDLPLAHFMALKGIASLPTPVMDRAIAKVANCGLLLFSYVGSDFSRRYLGHYGGGADAEDAARLVRDWPGTGAGYISSFPPMGLALTVKRVGRRVALNFSLHDGIAPASDLDRLACAVREEIEAYARLGRAEP
jgi:hypothetical protein